MSGTIDSLCLSGAAPSVSSLFGSLNKFNQRGDQYYARSTDFLSTGVLLQVLPAKLKSENLLMYGGYDEPLDKDTEDDIDYISLLKKYPSLSPSIIAMFASAKEFDMSMKTAMGVIDFTRLKSEGFRANIIAGNENVAKNLQKTAEQSKGIQVNIKANGEIWNEKDQEKYDSKHRAAKIFGMILNIMLTIAAAVLTCVPGGQFFAAVILVSMAIGASICKMVGSFSTSLNTRASAHTASFFFNFSPFSQGSELVFIDDMERAGDDVSEQKKVRSAYKERQKWTSWADLGVSVALTLIGIKAPKNITDTFAKLMKTVAVISSIVNGVLQIVEGINSIVEGAKRIKLAELNFKLSMYNAQIEFARKALESETATLSTLVEGVSQKGNEMSSFYKSIGDSLKSTGNTNIFIARNLII